MVVCKMAAVGCMRDNGTLEGDESSEKEGDLMRLCRKNGIYQDCFMGENARDSLDTKASRSERPQRVNGTSKSVSAIFTKPSIPTLRSRRDRVSPEQSKRRRRLSKGESADLRTRCCSQDGGRVLGAADTGEPTPCKLELTCDGKLGLASCGMAPSCVCPSATQEVCASSPQDLLAVRGLGLGVTRGDGLCGGGGSKRERRNSGASTLWSKPDSIPCLSLQFNSYTPPPVNSPPPLLIPAVSSSSSSNSSNSGSNSSSLSSSPLSSIPSPSRAGAALFGPSRGVGLPPSPQHHHQTQPQPPSLLNKGSSSSSSSTGFTHTLGSSSSSGSNSNNNSIISTTAGGSCSNSGTSTPTGTASLSSSTASSPAAQPAPSEESAVTCRWSKCGSVVSPADLLDHLRLQHVDTQSGGETFVCEWAGCKVAGKASCSMSWLERHVVAHGGHKPFKCIVPNCGARFPSELALQRHVNAHFAATETQAGNQKPSRPRGEDSGSRILRKRSKIKRRRPQCVRNGDFFDSGVMDRLREELWELTEKTRLDVDIQGSSHHVTFHSSVLASRTDEAGKMSVLLRWTPEDILEDTWVPASQVSSLRQRVVPFSQLPPSSVASLHPSLYRRLRFRKHRRK